MNWKFIACLLVIKSLIILYANAQEPGIACLGNGSLAVYEQRGNVLQLFGPPYSAPSVMQMMLDNHVQVQSKRDSGTAIWQHTLYLNGKQVAVITDFVDSEKPSFIRHIKATDTFRIQMSYAAKTTMLNNESVYKSHTPVISASLMRTPSGTFFYNTYPVPEEICYQFLLTGNAALQENIIHFSPGVTTIYVVGGPSYPECIENAQSSLSNTIEMLQQRTKQWWLSFTAKRKNFDAAINKDVPQRDKLLQTIDDVAVIIKTQQSKEGAVLAGYNYHLGYVRDQYGVSRCLLKLGYYDEAKQILNFYWNIWKRKNTLHNAQGIGIDAFHVHENDEVEITGYLIVQAFDYLANTKDSAFITTIQPMLDWAYNKQAKNLIKYMLPFNGDETYVAGGILPRNTLLDGSAEATLLFITGGDLLVNWVEKNKTWTADSIRNARALLVATRAHYQANFIDKGKLLTNNPQRMQGEQYPPFRHGVCEAMGAPPCEFFGWTQKTSNNRYLCPVCYATKSLPAVTSEKYYLQSVSLTPYYIHSNVLTDEQVKELVKDVTITYKRTGNFPSRPGSTNNVVGYDYGLLLYSLTYINDPLKNEIYSKMMAVLDDAGSWVEYYQNNKPSGTRCRPWESGINLEAAIYFAESYR